MRCVDETGRVIPEEKPHDHVLYVLGVVVCEGAMSIDIAVVRTWDAAKFLAEYEKKQALHQTLVGTLYPPIVADELQQLRDYCERVWLCHPSQLREKGIVYSSWTSSNGLVHNPFVRECFMVYSTPWIHGIDGQYDEPPKELTCLWCVATR